MQGCLQVHPVTSSSTRRSSNTRRHSWTHRRRKSLGSSIVRGSAMSNPCTQATTTKPPKHVSELPESTQGGARTATHLKYFAEVAQVERVVRLHRRGQQLERHDVVHRRRGRHDLLTQCHD